jgi:non-heme chloroperoxidase
MLTAGSPIGVDLAHQVVGSGRPLVFLHGWGMGLGCWDRQVTDLAGEFTTVTVDLRGHGASPKPIGPYDYEAHVADVVRLLEGQDLNDVVLVGWSMGGAIAARVAAGCDRVARVVLVGAPARFTETDDFPWGRPVQAADDFIAAIDADREHTLWVALEQTFHQPVTPWLMAWLFGISAAVPTWAAVASFAGVRAGDVRPDIAASTKPILLMHGAHDVFVDIGGARHLAQEHDHVALTEFADSGHAPFLEERAAFTEALRAFARA